METNQLIKKLIVFLILSVFCIELIIGYFYFQKSWEKGSSIKWFTKRVNEKYFQTELINPDTPNKLEYQHDLKRIIDNTNKNNIKIIMLYIPMTNTDIHSSIDKRDYFKQLAKINNILFIDTTEALSLFPIEWVYNTPFDGHLSRFGHLQISNMLLEKLDEVWNVKNDINSKVLNREFIGPHPKNVDAVNRYNQLAYRVQTNSQGFRMLHDIEANKRSIMILGDSFTYGTGVNTFETYSSLLNKQLDDFNIINAGIPGSTIVEQSRYFNRIKNSIMIDALLLQVLDNDIK